MEVESVGGAPSHIDKNASPTERPWSNILWLSANQAVAVLDGIIVGAAVARHLGPGGFGSLSNGIALVALTSPLVRLGLDRVAVRELVRRPDNRGPVFWSVFVLQMVAAAGLFVFSQGLKLWSVFGSDETGVIIACLVGLAFEWLAVPRLLLEAEVDSRWDVCATVFWRLASGALRLWLIASGATAVHFAWVHVATTIVTAITVFVVVSRRGLLPRPISPSVNQMVALLRESWPLAIAAISVTVYMNIDMLMLHHLKGAESAGVYSVAVRMATLFYFLPMAISSSFFPRLTRLHSGSNNNFEAVTQEFFNLNATIAYSVIGMSLLVFPAVIRLLFQDAYSESVAVFRIHVFSNMFVFLGVARGAIINLERRHRFAMLSTLIAAIVNVALNLWWIPTHAEKGAALATVVSYGVAVIVTTLAYSPTQRLGRQQLRSFVVGPVNVLRQTLNLVCGQKPGPSQG